MNVGVGCKPVDKNDALEAIARIRQRLADLDAERMELERKLEALEQKLTSGSQTVEKPAFFDAPVTNNSPFAHDNGVLAATTALTFGGLSDLGRRSEHGCAMLRWNGVGSSMFMPRGRRPSTNTTARRLTHFGEQCQLEQALMNPISTRRSASSR